MDLVGHTLDSGRLQITALLGRGGFGSVWKGVQLGLDREVAVKVLHELFATDEHTLRRFHREGQAIAQLDHPNIVRVYHSGSEGDIHYLVTNLLGGTVKERLADGPLELAAALKVAADVARALAYAHARGVIHRDIKPSNIMFDQAGNAVLTDFGLVGGSAFTQLTAAGSLIGSPAYMSPEQIAPHLYGDVDHRSDLYSLGCVIFELVAGKPPFQAQDPFLVARQHLHDPAPPLGGAAPACPPALADLVARLLEKKPGDRHPSAEAVLADLARIGEAAGVELRAAPEEAPSRVGSRAAGPKAVRGARGHARGRRALIFAAGAAAVLTVVVVLARVAGWATGGEEVDSDQANQEEAAPPVAGAGPELQEPAVMPPVTPARAGPAADTPSPAPATAEPAGGRGRGPRAAALRAAPPGGGTGILKVKIARGEEVLPRALWIIDQAGEARRKPNGDSFHGLEEIPLPAGTYRVAINDPTLEVLGEAVQSVEIRPGQSRVIEFRVE